MAAPVHSHLALLQAHPERYGFFQAVRLLLRGAGIPAGTRAIPPDALRFGATLGLFFPPNEIASIDRPVWAGADGPQLMRVNFMGLAGPSGVLPRHYTEWLMALRQARDPAAQDFLDLFNHRLIELFWRAWARHRPEVALESDAESGVHRHVYDLIGMGTPYLYGSLFPRRAAGSQARRRPLPGAALGYYAGLLSQRPHGAGSLAQVMSDYLRAPVAVESCVGTWQEVPAGDRTRLGRQAATLGRQCVLGSRFWDRQSTLRLRVGPLRRRHFEQLLPPPDKRAGWLDGTVELARFMTGLALDLRIRLAVRADEVRPLRLGGAATDAARLGWNTWLGGRRSARPADDCEFQFSATGGQSWR